MAEAKPPPVAYEDGRLTVHLRNMATTLLLGEVGRVTGAEVNGNVEEVRQVSARFEAVPLQDALARLLGRQPFLLIYDRDDRLRRIELIGKGEAISIAAQPQPSSVAKSLPASADNLAILAEHHAPVRLGYRDAKAFGLEELTFQELLGMGLEHEDQATRARAIGAGIKAVEDDPELREVWRRAAQEMDEDRAETLLRRLAGDRAAELASYVSRQSRFTEVRQKASAVHRKLR